ncbi:hypothetical protein Ancab_031769 [Ancistrocladus abbreviatus]
MSACMPVDGLDFYQLVGRRCHALFLEVKETSQKLCMLLVFIGKLILMVFFIFFPPVLSPLIPCTALLESQFGDISVREKEECEDTLNNCVILEFWLFYVSLIISLHFDEL